jgi:hypothetical protein
LKATGKLGKVLEILERNWKGLWVFPGVATWVEQEERRAPGRLVDAPESLAEAWVETSSYKDGGKAGEGHWEALREAGRPGWEYMNQ